MTTLFPIPEHSQVPVLGSDLTFPVRRVYCVGRNYVAHAKEMGHNERETPFFFNKPADALVVNPKSVPYPTMTEELHHEVELVLAINQEVSDADEAEAQACIYGYALGIDLTKRDLQDEAKLKGRPWDLSKGFDQSAPISSILPLDDIKDIEKGPISLSVNDEIRQEGELNQMIWSPTEIVQELSRHIILKPGDLIFTGTPSGVGSVERGDRVVAKVNEALDLDFIVE
ncbi:fumarylacetoacetate hydrolase family protein [Kangiella sediminilitoris]|uniref:Fumarylacetoacetase n=1 Tax=Kangiella sediminilitoris TaxID=1144748 RepID=A0A1B3BCM6_9GAMM|nr:fumarylacetoacetate hydrolase family protein [Kangiella sediminilitoris]AOE50560.1 fumarylacetoacetase [Kangiella sediminilitoris]